MNPIDIIIEKTKEYLSVPSVLGHEEVFIDHHGLISLGDDE
jgi:hypothetical protein